MIGLIKYTAALPVRMRSPYHAADFWGQLAVGQQSDVLPIGSEVEVLLDWGYTNLDPIDEETRSVSSTPDGYSEVWFHGNVDGWRVKVSWVNEIREAGKANDFQALRSLNAHLRRGQVLWFPDYDNFPDESVYCIAKKTNPPRREGNLMKWSFSFDLMELPAAQIPSNLPSFATV